MAEIEKEPVKAPAPTTPTPPQPNAIQKTTRFFMSPGVRERFIEILGKQNAGPYIASVLIAVGNSKKLQECTIPSIFHAAERAASLRLSVDPSSGQAHLVPYKDKCTLIVGYKGYYDMAVRTEKYRYINVHEIYEGQTITPDLFSGEINQSSLGGSPISNRVIGWLGVFEMRSGYSHAIYLTVEEVHKHAARYAQSYNYTDSPWKTETAKMERKTVLSMLIRKWGYLDPTDVMHLEAIEEGEEEEEDLAELGVIDGEWSEPAEEPKPVKTEAELVGELTGKKVKETPINAAIHTYRDLQERAKGLDIPFTSTLPEKCTIEQVRKEINDLTQLIVKAELNKVDGKATQPGLVS
jgi:recombination protein RecT